ncbi:MAG: signal peptidase I [Clostridiales bacterium]|nr:signal peptidase I [Clostridiales bacterium]
MKLINKTADSRSTALDVIAFIVMAAVMIFTAYVMINTGRGKVIKIFGKSVMRVVTGSMEPTIHTGDFIIVSDPGDQALKEGDIIAFYSDDPDVRGSVVTHRIIGINDDGSYRTKGDANTLSDDYPVNPSKVVGRYTGKARFFRWIGSFADKKKLLFVLVIIPVLFISFFEVKTIASLRKKIIEEEELEEEQDEIEKIKRKAVEEYLKKREEDKDGKEEGQ